MKKILFLIPTLGGGGAERVLVNLVNNLDQTKYQITIQTLFKSGVNAQFLRKEITIKEGRFRQFRGNVLLLKMFSSKNLFRFFIREKYDIIVSYLEGPTARIVAGCTDKSTKLVSWIHVEQHTSEAMAYSFRSVPEALSCYHRFDMTVFVSETVQQDFLSLCHPMNHIVLYNTNDDTRIRSLAKQPLDYTLSDQINVFTIGRLVEQKGFDRLVEVHKLLLDEGFQHHLYILGEGEERALLTHKINDLGLSESCHLLGFKENPYPYLAKADLFVCSSRREGFSTAVTESLILGVPVVSTCCSGAYELLGQNNEYGVVTENSTTGILDGMRKMLADPCTLQHYKQQAALRGAQFSKEKTVAAVEYCFDQLLKGESV